MSKIDVFGHFLGKPSIKVSNFLHDCRGQSFGCDAIFGKNLNLGSIRGLSRDEAHFGSFSIEICQFFSFSLDNLV